MLLVIPDYHQYHITKITEKYANVVAHTWSQCSRGGCHTTTLPVDHENYQDLLHLLSFYCLLALRSFKNQLYQHEFLPLYFSKWFDFNQNQNTQCFLFGSFPCGLCLTSEPFTIIRCVSILVVQLYSWPRQFSSFSPLSYHIIIELHMSTTPISTNMTSKISA